MWCMLPVCCNLAAGANARPSKKLKDSDFQSGF